jgi:hypothetical protein
MTLSFILLTHKYVDFIAVVNKQIFAKCYCVNLIKAPNSIVEMKLSMWYVVCMVETKNTYRNLIRKTQELWPNG